MRYQEKGVSDEHMLARYQDLTGEGLEAAKKRWNLHKKTAREGPGCKKMIKTIS
ncbi:hypothetical protein [Domibacillus indicus]|uniref:hypothetical protein n=1 Tax=Domibacillus indicus TaxID=1437523 RepID=UPI000AB59FBC|nr:hypothetical protein [Domibacillus indicus]